MTCTAGGIGTAGCIAAVQEAMKEKLPAIAQLLTTIERTNFHLPRIGHRGNRVVDGHHAQRPGRVIVLRITATGIESVLRKGIRRKRIFLVARV